MAKCKSCNGNNAKKLSVIEKMGTETGTASTTGIGVSGGGVGVGFGKTSINKKSNLAREASFRASDAEKDEWERTWMCLDCGHKWVEPIPSNMFDSSRGAIDYKNLKLLQKNLRDKASKKYSKLEKEINKKEKEIIKKTRQLERKKDTETREIKPIHKPLKMFHKIFYSDSKETLKKE